MGVPSGYGEGRGSTFKIMGRGEGSAFKMGWGVRGWEYLQDMERGEGSTFKIRRGERGIPER